MDCLLNSSAPIPAAAVKPEAELAEVSAVGALVGLVRMALVILICVLLVKLRSPDKRARRDQQDDADEPTTVAQKLYIRILIATSKLVNTLVRLDSQIEVSGASKFSDAPTAATLNGRRKSQPVIQAAAQAAAPRVRRRHSDTSLAHLNLPPGPMGLPFLGYLPFVGREIHLTLSSLSERYGPIYQVFLGGIRVVVLNDAALVRQAFKQPVFSGRPDTQLTRILQGYGIVNSDGALWREQRAFLHTALRKLGAKSLMSGANGLEAKIQVSVRAYAL